LNYQNPVIVEQEDYVPDVSRPLAASSTINHYDESQQTYVAFGGNRTSGKIEKATAINAGHGSRRYDFDTETFLTFNNRQDPIISEDVSQPIGSKDNGLGICWEMSHPDDPARQHGDVAPTLQRRMGTGGNQVPMIGVRRLTPTECERLQGFPDHWTAVLSKYPGRMAKEDIDYFRNQLEDSYGRPFSDDEVRKIASDTARYQQLGNAVAVPVARWLGKRIVMVDRMYNW
jgi:site-specific DNA-cytosine methylase